VNEKTELTVEIEHGIPIPALYRKGESKYPWHQMAVGDSFFVPSSARQGAYIASGVPRSIRYSGAKFSVRKSEKDGVPGFRVWRVK
jgi:hypothetical protein